MSVYVDEMMPCVTNASWPWSRACHMYADGIDELVRFAVGIGLKTEWLQRNTMPHFDLTGSKRIAALSAGAVEHSRKQMVEFMQAYRNAH